MRRFMAPEYIPVDEGMPDRARWSTRCAPEAASVGSVECGRGASWPASWLAQPGPIRITPHRCAKPLGAGDLAGSQPSPRRHSGTASTHRRPCGVLALLTGGAPQHWHRVVGRSGRADQRSHRRTPGALRLGPLVDGASFITESMAELAASLRVHHPTAEIVVASRVHTESRYLIRPSFFRHLYTRHSSGRFLNWLVRVLLLPGLSDTQAGLKGFSADAAVSLFAGWIPDGFGFDLAVLARVRRAGMVVVEVPVTFRYDREPSTMRSVADTFDMLRDLAMVRLRVGHGDAILPSGGGESAARSEAVGSPPWQLLLVLALLLAGVEIARSVAAPLLVPLGLRLAALGLWLGHGLSEDRARGVGPTRWFEDPLEAAVVIGTVLLAAFFRLAALSEIPTLIHHDTASCALVGKAMLTGASLDPFALEQGWYHFPRLGLLPYEVSLKLLGTNIVALRLVSALPGILLVLAVSFLVRGWFGRAAATIAGFYMASNHVAVYFSRDGIWNIHSLTLGVIGFAALFGGWQA